MTVPRGRGAGGPEIDRDILRLMEDAVVASSLPDLQVRWVGPDGRVTATLGSPRGEGCSGSESSRLERACNAYGKPLGRLELVAGSGGGAELDRLADQLERLLIHLLKARLEVDSLSAELALMYEELNLLFEIEEDLATRPQANGVWDQLLERIARIVPARSLAAVLADEASGRLHVVAAWGEAAPGSITLEGSWTEKALREGHTHQFTVDESTEVGREGFEASVLTEVLIVPLPRASRAEGPRGAIVLSDRAGGAFTASERKLVEMLAQHVASLVRGLRSAELGREMEIARRLQRSLLPGQDPELPDLRVASSCVPAGLVGGDYYDFFKTASGQFGVVVGDVSGHGFGSALMMATARTVFRREAERADSLEKILAGVNRQLHADLQAAGHLLTLVAVVWDPSERQVRFAAAGHPAPLVRRRGGEVWTLDARGMVIGLSPDAEFVEGWAPMEPGDSLVLYTDGVTEARSPDGCLFGEARLRAFLADKEQREASAWHNALVSAVDSHRDGREPDDDVTLVVLEFR